ASGAEDEGDTEQGNQEDQSGVGEFLADGYGRSARHVHRSPRTHRVPETRPMSTTSPTLPLTIGRIVSRSRRARASPAVVASVWAMITATATSSPGTNPCPVISTSSTPRERLRRPRRD